MKRFITYSLFFAIAIGAGMLSYQWQLSKVNKAPDPQKTAYKGYVGGDFKLNSFDGVVVVFI